MNRFAIYTAVVGNYDEIRQPLVVDPHFDYFLFSDTIKEKRIGVWQIRPIEYTNPDQVKIARYVKTHPDTLLPEYDATLWLDATIQIVNFWIYERFFTLIKNNSTIASVKHPDRVCIFEEIVAVCSLGYESIETCRKWYNMLRLRKFPKHFGLHETNILFRVNNNDNRKHNDIWWQYINKYSCRDQLSFDYVLWEQQKSCTSFFLSDETVWTSSFVKYFKHPKHNSKVGNKFQSNYLLRLWDYYNMGNPAFQKSFFKVWLTIFSFPLPIANVFFCVWRNILRIESDIYCYLN